MTSEDMDRLRADFADTFRYWLASGEISQREHNESRAEAATAIRDGRNDPEFMAWVSTFFAQRAAMLRADIQRVREANERIKESQRIAREAEMAERIKTEVREEREAR